MRSQSLLFLTNGKISKTNLVCKIQSLFISCNTEYKDKSMMNWVGMALNGVIARDAFSVMRTAGSLPWNANTLLLCVVSSWLTALKDYLLSEKKD